MPKKKLAIIGGCGHVGLPLGVKLALAGYETRLVDIDNNAIKTVNSGKFPFLEKGGDSELAEAITMGLVATSDPSVCAECDAVVFVTGTPVDEHLNPKISDVLNIFDIYQKHLKPNTLVIMRSTLFPGTMEHIYNRINQQNFKIRLAFCPERVAQGYGLEEIDSLPQIVSAFDNESFDAACELFSNIAPEIIRLQPIEAEMAKLMANSWRYLEFAIANQFYMIAESKGVDFFRVYDAIRHNYPRAKGYKSPGFAAGPCLFKDTMQLASFFDNQFYMGHAAMLVNEGLATFAVQKTCALFNGSQLNGSQLNGSLWGKKIGLLGLAFKADNDDTRESLSFKVKKGLEFHGAEVLENDPFIAGTTSIPELLEVADAFVLCTPHSEYSKLSTKKPIIDIWGMYRESELEIHPGTKNTGSTARLVANA